MSFNDPLFLSIISTNVYDRHRKPLIKEIQKILKSKLIIYIASPFHPASSIISQDIILFEDLLRSIAPAKKCHLMINSPGGSADVAEKIIMMCRHRFTEEFNIIVPDYAKSAATMIALGSDKILMGYLSELGPIDPQLRTSFTGSAIPARSFLDGLEMIRKNITNDGDPVQMYYPMLSQISPQILAMCQSAIDRSRRIAENCLKQHMLKNDPKQAKKVATWLSEGKAYKSHGKVIDFKEAHDVLKLNVELIPENSELWSRIWELYCREVVYLQNHQSQGASKLFESESVSLASNIQIRTVQRTTQRPVQQPQKRRTIKLPQRIPIPKKTQVIPSKTPKPTTIKENKK